VNEEARAEDGVGAIALSAYALLTFALFRSDGYRDGLALLVIIAATALAAVGVLGRRSYRPPARLLLVALAVAQLVALGVGAPGACLTPGTSLLPFRLGLLAALALVLLYLPRRGPAALLRFPLLLALFVALGVWLLRASPAPSIDVWHFQRQAVELLLHLRNPYAATYPNIYAHGAPFDGRWLPGDVVSRIFLGGNLEDGRVVSHAYPPLSVLATVPGVALGDPRWSQLAALALTATLLIVIARRRGRPAGDVLELVAVLFLFHPRGFFLLEMSWTEPFLALAAVALFVAVASRRWVATALAAFVSMKQYAFLGVPALLGSGLVTLRQTRRAAALALAVAAPFVLWNPAAFWRGVVSWQFRLDLRSDALTVPAWLLQSTGRTYLSEVLGLLAALLAVALTTLAVRRRPQQPDAVALGTAVVFLALFLFHKQAFFNYYWFAGVLLLLSVAVGPTTPVVERVA